MDPSPHPGARGRRAQRGPRARAALTVRAACAALALWLGLAAPAQAGGLVDADLAAPSPVLGRPIPYAVYRPAAAPPPGERWPVLYLLHGLRGGETDWLKQGNLAAILDAETMGGRVRPLLVVMPMAESTWYVDNPDPGGAGAVARALTTDLIAAVEARYPAAGCRASRAIGGLSMGGYGALLYAFDRPDLYAAAISLSGSIFREMPEDEAARAARPVHMFGPVFGTPFDWRRFNAWNLYPRIPRLAAAPQRPALWLAAGDEDYRAILDGTRLLHQRLVTAGLDAQLSIEAGRHDWGLWSSGIVPALAWLSPRLDPACRQP